MTYNDVRKNENKGFSLVELIVVIAIMAVLVAVLAPSLLQYVERSRAQKDDSAMGEVTNAVMLALADQDVYDEVLVYTIKGNFSSYVDSANGKLAQVQETKASDANQWMFKDDARLKDEELYSLAGTMRGVTITFWPATDTNKSVFTLADAKVNLHKQTHTTGTAEYINGATPVGGMTFGTMDSKVTGGLAANGAHNYLYNRVRATVGDKIELTSQTYRNSPYTVFIRMGSTGGKEAAAQDAIAVYGQWAGTNLDKTDVLDTTNNTLKIASGTQAKPTT